jgi:hypothetical protein
MARQDQGLTDGPDLGQDATISKGQTQAETLPLAVPCSETAEPIHPSMLLEGTDVTLRTRRRPLHAELKPCSLLPRQRHRELALQLHATVELQPAGDQTPALCHLGSAIARHGQLHSGSHLGRRHRRGRRGGRRDGRHGETTCLAPPHFPRVQGLGAPRGAAHHFACVRTLEIRYISRTAEFSVSLALRVFLFSTLHHPQVISRLPRPSLTFGTGNVFVRRELLGCA